MIDLLRKKMPLKLIAELCQVSSTAVIRVLKSLEKYIPANQPEACLSKVLMVDEFRSHAKKEDKMSFICADGKTGKLIGVLPSRKLAYLNKHIKRYYPNDLEKVQFIVTDMNAAYFKLADSYFKLADSYFKKAEIIVDRFHVVSHMNKAFNEFRVRENKELIKSKEKKKAGKLKTNWKLLLKDRQTINWHSYHSCRSFPRPKFPYLTEGMVIDSLLAFSDALKQTYSYFHDLQDAFRKKVRNSFV